MLRGFHRVGSNKIRFEIPGFYEIVGADKFLISDWPVSEENLRRQLQRPFDKMLLCGHPPRQQVEALIGYLKTL